MFSRFYKRYKHFVYDNGQNAVMDLKSGQTIELPDKSIAKMFIGRARRYNRQHEQSIDFDDPPEELLTKLDLN